MIHIRQLLLLTLFALLFLLSNSARCQSLEARSQNTRSISTARVDHAPVLDGTLQDPLWGKAATVAEFYQREPFERERATEKTDVRVISARRFLYFGIHCFDSEPKGIVATELRRDADFSVDDTFTILLS